MRIVISVRHGSVRGKPESQYIRVTMREHFLNSVKDGFVAYTPLTPTQLDRLNGLIRDSFNPSAS